MKYYKIKLIDCFLNTELDSCFVKSFRSTKDLSTFLDEDPESRFQVLIKKCLKKDISSSSICLYDTDFKNRCNFVSFGRQFFKKTKVIK